MRNLRVLAMVFVFIVFFISINAGCIVTEETPLPLSGFNYSLEDIDIGAVTFFTRLSTNIPEDKRKLLFDIYQKYGSVSFEWSDNKQQAVDILVKGAPIEWAPSFVQENIELKDKNLIYWRFDEIWYRANFQLYTISFPFTGQINPDANLYLDTGSGFDPVPLENDGSFEVMLPFSLQKTIVFAKIELVKDDLVTDDTGSIIRYKRINIVNSSIDEITEQQYEYERTIYSSVEKDDLGNTPDPTPIDDYTPPETPEPAIDEGPTKEWFKIDKSAEPKLEGFVTKKSPEKDGTQTKPKEEIKPVKPVKEPEEKAIVLPKRKGEPPKSLGKSLPVTVYLVFKGLSENDNAIRLIKRELEGFTTIIQAYYDNIEEAYIFRLDVLDNITDIKRIHNALSSLSTRESLQMSNRSRYFGIKMTPLNYTSQLKTQISGHVLPNSVVNIFVAPDKPEHNAIVDEDGNFSAEIPLPSGTSYVYGKMIFNNETRFFQVAVLTGKLDEITKKQYDLAIKEITEHYNKKTGNPK